MTSFNAFVPSISSCLRSVAFFLPSFSFFNIVAGFEDYTFSARFGGGSERSFSNKRWFKIAMDVFASLPTSFVAVPLRAFYRNEHLIVRWLPMLRLNKCAKMWYFASYLPQHSLSRHSYATQKIIRIFGMFWLVTHWAGCGWLFRNRLPRRTSALMSLAIPGARLTAAVRNTQ